MTDPDPLRITCKRCKTQWNFPTIEVAPDGTETAVYFGECPTCTPLVTYTGSPLTFTTKDTPA